eukprot:1136681-Pelagomonas_calceolata.AAC.12
MLNMKAAVASACTCITYDMLVIGLLDQSPRCAPALLLTGLRLHKSSAPLPASPQSTRLAPLEIKSASRQDKTRKDKKRKEKKRKERKKERKRVPH